MFFFLPTLHGYYSSQYFASPQFYEPGFKYENSHTSGRSKNVGIFRLVGIRETFLCLSH